MVPGCGTFYYGTFYYGTFCCGTIYYGTIAFDPSPSVIFIVSETACILLICSLIFSNLLYCPTILLVHCIKYRYLGFLSTTVRIRGAAFSLGGPHQGAAFPLKGLHQGPHFRSVGCIRGPQKGPHFFTQGTAKGATGGRIPLL